MKPFTRCCLLFVSFLLIAILLAYNWRVTSGYGSFGSADFIEFWSAYQVLLSGNNPYDPQKLLPIQQLLGRDGALLIWYPPWAVSLISAILAFDFQIAIYQMLAINISLISLTCHLASLTVTSRGLSLHSLILAIFFLPAWDLLYLGQLSILLAFGVASFLYLQKRGAYFFAGMSLSLITLKPHLLYLFLVGTLWWVLKTKNYKILIGAIFGTIILIVTSQMQFPNSLSWWISSFDHPPYYWIVASAVGMYRWIYFQLTGDFITSPIILIPAIACVSTWVYFILKQPALSLEKLAAPLICLSLFLSPYGWFFDQAILLVAQTLMLESMRESLSNAKFRQLFAALVLLQFSIALYFLLGYREHGHYFWVPLAMLIIWAIFYRTDRATA